MWNNVVRLTRKKKKFSTTSTYISVLQFFFLNFIFYAFSFSELLRPNCDILFFDKLYSIFDAPRSIILVDP